MNLLILDPGERSLAPDDPRARHILRVLKLARGDELRAGELGGSVGTARVTATSGGRVELSFTGIARPRPLAGVELVLGHPRPIVLRRLLRDLAAIGPARIAVTVTDLGEKSYYRANLWDDIATPLREGAAQGGTTLLPEVVRHWSLARALERVHSPAGRRLTLHADEAGVPHLLDVLAGLDPPPGGTAGRREKGTPGRREKGAGDGRENGAAGRREVGGGGEPGTPASETTLTVAVGSERGWSDRELALLSGSGFTEATLGGRILRTETAAIAAVWAAVSWYDGRRETGDAQHAAPRHP